MKRLGTSAVIAAVVLAAAGPAAAFDRLLGLDELRLGVLEHDVAAFNEGSGDFEDGFNVAAEVVFKSPGPFRYILSPRPYGIFSWNSAGDTNFGGGGLNWTTPAWRDRLFAEAGVGYVLHDGVVELPSDPANPDRIRLAATRVTFGSRDLFRTHFAAGVRVTPRLDAAFVVEHLSHGQILGDDSNQGLDNIGLRLSYRVRPNRRRPYRAAAR